MTNINNKSEYLIAEIFSLLDKSDVAVVKINQENERLRSALAECQSEKTRLEIILADMAPHKAENERLVSLITERDSEITHLRSLLSLWPARLMLKIMRHFPQLKL